MPVPRSIIVSRGMRGICQNGNFSKRDFPGGTFSAPTVRGFAVYGRRERAGPAAGQEGRHQGFYPLNSHFLLFLSLAQIAYM